MEEISLEEFKDRDANSMAAVAADDRKFYDLGDDTLGVLGRYEGDGEVEIRGHVLTPTVSYNGQLRVSGSKSESGRLGDGEERAREKVEEWLLNNG